MIPEKPRVSALEKGERVPNWRTRVKCVCLHCGNEFHVYPSQIKKGGGKHCSISCRNKAIGAARVKCKCLHCGKEFYLRQSKINSGRGKYCSRSCVAKAKVGENHPSWKGGANVSSAKRRFERRNSGSAFLLPLSDGEVGHHVTNEAIIGIPAEVYEKLGGTRDIHRAKILEWLKDNDTHMYNLVLLVLKNEKVKIMEKEKIT